MAQFKQVIAPNSPAAVRLALLAGFNADLTDALYGFSIALHMIESNESSEQNLARRLVSDATIAYVRCFSRSNVRPNLDTIIAVPDGYADAHRTLKRLRNSTVAHSESTLTPSYAVVSLERDETTGKVWATEALAMTVHFSFSAEVIRLFHDLVKAVKARLLVEIESAKGLLVTELNTKGEIVALWAEGVLPQIAPIAMEEWDVDSRRASYPDSHVIPVVAAPVRTFLAPSSGDDFEGEADAI
ncbi:hypothetical protein MUN74_18435 [Agromyces endophyticus]|uniref:hypothetical protein n=1 Tax=Agromyces sp. H17E-10 TaxID=2932244 RepID=UPI001FD2D2AD|nr:hypothetical protein [Agromyces sp. H17E-10]UOQ89210.1 hypothetical protein MUN74_18435 [Agromyces sp. H17E-10]